MGRSRGASGSDVTTSFTNKDFRCQNEVSMELDGQQVRIEETLQVKIGKVTLLSTNALA